MEFGFYCSGHLNCYVFSDMGANMVFINLILGD